MNRKDFGKMFQAFREQFWDYETGKLGITRKRLAKRAALKGLTANVIVQLEQGTLVNLSPERLVALANALCLTSDEREQLFAGASGVDNTLIPAPEHNLQEMYDKCLEVIQKVQTPALVTNQYFDILAINAALPPVLDLENWDTWKQNPRNLLDLVFDPYRPQLRLLTNGRSSYEHLVRGFLLAFRSHTLRYRATRHYRQLYQRLDKDYTLFSRYEQSSHANLDRDYFEGDVIEYDSTKWDQPLRFMLFNITYVTKNGPLRVTALNPADHLVREGYRSTRDVYNEVLDKFPYEMPIFETAPFPYPVI